jgi:DNA integrity scanning protein DisA with diadenylate cyclase activity
LTPGATLDVVHALYRDFLERGIRHFFPEHRLDLIGEGEPQAVLQFHHQTDGSLEMEWCGGRYFCSALGRALSEHELRLLGAIGDVLAARYRSIIFGAPAASALHLFRGLPEDRFVSAFLDHTPYLDQEGIPSDSDAIAGAIEVLRESSLLTYENRRISTGLLMLGPAPDPAHPRPDPPSEALPYNSDLIGVKSFHRLCDGIKTVFLVNRSGLLLDLIDIHDWSRGTGRCALAAPTASIYHCHNVATYEGGHLCLVLTPNGEIKIFAEGVQAFNFLGGRWRLTDMGQKYRAWHKSVGDAVVSERIFRSTLNMAESRRGGLFVILDDRGAADALVARADMLDHAPERPPVPPYSKDHVHYLLCGKSVLDLEPTVLESVARMDGGIVLDRAGNLIAVGAILRNEACEQPQAVAEGGRTTAAMSASRFGDVLKVSEDGSVTYYRDGAAVWEI